MRQALLERCPFGVFISDAVRVTYANRLLCEITGYRRDELLRIRSPFQVLFAPEERGRLCTLAQQLLHGDPVPAMVECRGLLKGGAGTWWALWMARIRWDGRPALLGIVAEIDERKRIEGERSEMRGTLAQRNHDLIALNRVLSVLGRSMDLREGLRVALQEALSQCNVHSGAILIGGLEDGTAVTVIAHGLLQDVGAGTPLGRTLRAACAQAAATNRVLCVVGDSVLADDGAAALAVSGFACMAIVPLQVGGELWGGIALLGREWLRIGETQLRLLMAIAAQIGQAVTSTRLRDLAAQIQVREGLVAAQSRFIADVSHEFRSPLGLIRAACQSLLSERVAFAPEVQQRMLGIVDQESAYLEALVENLLKLAQIGWGEMALSRERTDLVALAQSAVRRAEPGASGRRIVLAAEGAPLWADVDPVALSRVFANLLSNAIKYSPPGSAITVEVHTAGEEAAICVADEGIGIAPEHIGRLFERFYRVPGEATARARGVGLGLAVCKGIVEAHGGRIWVESAPGKGSRFTFHLPRDAEGGEV